jgi:hypothetical protein
MVFPFLKLPQIKAVKRSWINLPNIGRKCWQGRAGQSRNRQGQGMAWHGMAGAET